MNLNQITIPTIDLTKSVPFYEKLGLELIVLSMPRYARFKCPIGDSTFSIHDVNELPSGQGLSIYFEIENLDERVKELIDTGFKFDELPNDKPWLWREAKLKDPDGNQLVLYFAGKNRLFPPWRLAKE